MKASPSAMITISACRSAKCPGWSTRHPLTPLDQQLLQWLGDVPVLALLSKADKLTRREQEAVLPDVEERLGAAGNVRAVLFSSVSKQGVEECRGLLEAWLRGAGPAQAAEIKSPR